MAFIRVVRSLAMAKKMSLGVLAGLACVWSKTQ
jgi:hypothetical protein